MKQSDDNREEMVNDEPEGGSRRSRALRLLKEHVDAETWRRFRREAAAPLDLSGEDLSDLSLDGLELVGVEFSRCNISGASFRAADLRKAKLDFISTVRGDRQERRVTDFSGALLQLASLRNAVLDEVSFESSDLRGAIFEGAVGSGLNMQGANAVRACFDRCAFSDAQLNGATLVGASFRDAELLRPELRSYDGRPVDLRLARLDGARLCSVLWAENGVRCRGAALECFGDAGVARELRHQAWVEEMAERSRWHSAAVVLWKATCDCGRSFGRLSTVAMSLLIVFGFLYAATDSFLAKVGTQNRWIDGFLHSAYMLANMGFDLTVPVGSFGILLAAFEAGLGILLFGLLVAILTERAGRSK